MARRQSSIAPDWWDYTTLDPELVRDAAALTPEKILKLSRPGFKVVFYDTLEDFYLAEALEYVQAWQQSTPDNPVGICGPIQAFSHGLFSLFIRSQRAQTSSNHASYSFFIFPTISG